LDTKAHRRKPVLLEEKDSDAIHRETELGIAWAGAYYRGMILAGLNSLFEDFGDALKICGRIMQYK
jgi:hypothetical protein